MPTTPNDDLEELVAELNLVYPPPAKLSGVENTVPGSGRWVLGRVGSGVYAVRAEYTRLDGSTVRAKSEHEVVGFPAAIASSLRFTIGLMSATRHGWIEL